MICQNILGFFNVAKWEHVQIKTKGPIIDPCGTPEKLGWADIFGTGISLMILGGNRFNC